eukprot:COSAG01_NODE_5692_length_4095_cov_7.903904_3_plen_50_part_00
MPWGSETIGHIGRLIFVYGVLDGSEGYGDPFVSPVSTYSTSLAIAAKAG